MFARFIAVKRVKFVVCLRENGDDNKSDISFLEGCVCTMETEENHLVTRLQMETINQRKTVFYYTIHTIISLKSRKFSFFYLQFYTMNNYHKSSMVFFI